MKYSININILLHFDMINLLTYKVSMLLAFFSGFRKAKRYY